MFSALVWLTVITIAPVVGTLLVGAVVATNHAVNASKTG